VTVWVVTLAWAGLIFTLSTGTYGSSFSAWLLREFLRLLHLEVSPPTFGVLHFCLRKLAHLTEYGIFSSLLYGSLERGRSLEWRARTALWCVLIASAYSLTDEFHQSFVPGRTASWTDCAIDTVGAFLGMLLVYGDSRLTRVGLGRRAGAQ
jgi:VanZ family protein